MGIRFDEYPELSTYPADKDTTVNWKTYDNKFVVLTVENICEIQAIALNNLNKIWIKWG